MFGQEIDDGFGHPRSLTPDSRLRSLSLKIVVCLTQPLVNILFVRGDILPEQGDSAEDQTLEELLEEIVAEHVS